MAVVVRLWHIVIGAHFKAEDVVDNVAASGQHDYPDPKILSQPVGEGQTVLAGQYQIKDDEIDRGLRHDPAHSRAVLRDRDLVALAGQIFLDQIADVALIIDDQNVTVGVHAARLSMLYRQPIRRIVQARAGPPARCYKLLHEAINLSISPICAPIPMQHFGQLRRWSVAEAGLLLPT